MKSHVPQIMITSTAVILFVQLCLEAKQDIRTESRINPAIENHMLGFPDVADTNNYCLFRAQTFQ